MGNTVFNRLMEIGEITQHLEDNGQRVYFCHVKSQHRTTDCAATGLNRQELQVHFWFTGSPILNDHPDSWKYRCAKLGIDKFAPSITEFTSDEDSSTKHIHSSQKVLSRCDPPRNHDIQIFNLLEKYSLSTIKRTIAWILRYIGTFDAQTESPNQLTKLSSLWESVNVHNDSGTSGVGKILNKQH